MEKKIVEREILDREIMVGPEVSILAKLHVRKEGQPSGKGTVECTYPQLIIHGVKMAGGTIDIPYHILQIHKNTGTPVPTVWVKVNGIETEVPATSELVKALGINLHPELEGSTLAPNDLIPTDKAEKAAEKKYKAEIAKKKKLNKTE